jgi:signal transduction histidine kinase
LGMVRTETVSVFGDSNILAAAASNLIDNAIRHAGSTARVDVSVYADAQHAILEVADSGPGIAEEERARVTERFYRQPGSAIGGSGLGLAIVRASVERHHGTLEFGQSAMGGLLVRMRLPLAPARDQLQSRNG